MVTYQKINYQTTRQLNILHSSCQTESINMCHQITRPITNWNSITTLKGIPEPPQNTIVLSWQLVGLKVLHLEPRVLIQYIASINKLHQSFITTCHSNAELGRLLQINSILLGIPLDLKKAVTMIHTKLQGLNNQFFCMNANNLEDVNNKGLPRVVSQRTQSKSSYYNEEPNNEWNPVFL